MSRRECFRAEKAPLAAPEGNKGIGSWTNSKWTNDADSVPLLASMPAAPTHSQSIFSQGRNMDGSLCATYGGPEFLRTQ